MNQNELFERIRSYADNGAHISEWEKQIWEQFGCRRAVLVVDSTGFTRVTRSHGIVHYLLRITQLRKIVMSVFEQHGSVYFHAAADNIYAHFNTTDQAFDAAIAANAAVHEHKLMITETEPFSLCTGIGFGDLLNAGSEGLYGPEMNFASKLGEDIAEGREVLVTEAAWQSLSSDRQGLLEERHHGMSEYSLKYFWMHWQV